MKKKTLPILMLIAGLSTAALAACGHSHKYEWMNSEDGTTHWQECECGDKISEGPHIDVDENGKCDVCDAHVHNNYVLKTNALNHWQECECGHKVDESAHIDFKNNETGADEADHKCDVCGNEETVFFDMGGHGTGNIPANQFPAAGDKAILPEWTPTEDAWKFKGWYKDSDCTEEFDFETPISEKTTIYAKWEENTTPGESEKYAFTLSKGTQNLQSVKHGETIFFKFTAGADGRYTASLGSGVASQNSTFTTSLTGDTVYGKDQAADKANFDLEAGETVYVMLTYQGEDGEGLKASPLVGDTIDEPLPEGYFLSGDYAGSFNRFAINRDTKIITYNDNQYPFHYVGGKSDWIYFDMTNIGARNYLIHNEDGTYTFAQDDGWSYNEFGTVNYLLPKEPIPLSNLVGYYEPETSATYGIITELYIYASDSGESTVVRYLQDGSYYRADATYNTQNELIFNNYGYDYTVTLNLANDGSIESISVNGNVYLRKGDLGIAPPEALPLLDGSPDYSGDTYKIRVQYGTQYFGDGYDTIDVIDYAEGVYTIIADGTTYKLTFEDSKTIKLYQEDGTTLLDTLHAFEYIYHDFPANSTEISLTADDFQRGVYLYKVVEGGWYTFTGIPEDVQIYYNLDVNNLDDRYYSASLVGSGAVNLKKDMILGVFTSSSDEVSFTVASIDAPKGMDESNPVALEDNTATITGIASSTTYYFEFTALDAGSYLLHVFYDNGTGYGDSYLDYTVNGKPYSFTYGDTDYYTQITATAGQVFKINVTSGEYAFNRQSITVAVVEDYAAGAEDVTLTGTPAGDSVTLSATVTAGKNYHLASDTYGANVTATANAAFTVKLQGGVSVTATANGGSYTASIPADTDYFTIVSATSGLSITLSQTFAHGDIGYPFALSAAAGSNTLTATKTVYFTLPAGLYIVEIDADNTLNLGLYRAKDNSTVNFDAAFTAEEGELFYFANYRGTEVTLTVTEAVEIFTADQAGTYEGTTTDYYNTPLTVTLTFDTFGRGTYVIVGVGTNETQNIVISNSDGYSFEYSGYTVTFTFTDGGLSVTDNNFEKTYAMEKATPSLGGTYTGTYFDGSENVRVTLTLNEDMTAGTYTIQGDGTYSITITNFGDTYEFSYSVYGERYSGTFTDNGDGTLTLEDYFGDVTLTKQA